MKKGFTLVELSIVLVIIGLLIGGILVAQSMIGTAKITATVAQFQQYDAGVANFYTKYNQLPGDNTYFGLNATGYNNSLITQNPSVNYTGAFGNEIANFWPQVNLTAYPGATDYNLNTVPPITSGTGQNVPLAKIGKKGAYIIASAFSADGNFADATNPRNFYAILDPTQAQISIYLFSNTDATNSAVKPVELLALDKKMDDGFATQGNVLSGKLANSITTPGLDPACSTGDKYNAANDKYTCTPLIRLGSQTGFLQ